MDVKPIEKKEIWNWSPTTTSAYADAMIPSKLHQKLADAITFYRNVCDQIDSYLLEHPEARL